jgi:ElaB/YqjD/DUF883 family membrane-anchored ribosome-binding protein
MTAQSESGFKSPEESHAHRNAGSSASRGRTLSEQSARVVDEAQELGRVALAGAGEAAAQLRSSGRDALETGREKAVAAKGRLEELIAEHPLKSVLIAVGVGAVLGALLDRRVR